MTLANVDANDLYLQTLVDFLKIRGRRAFTSVTTCSTLNNIYSYQNHTTDKTVSLSSSLTNITQNSK